MGVKVGDKFIKQGDSWHNPHGRYGVTGTVAKVYKNGNFVFEGDKQQYRPSSSCRTATATGGRGWSREFWRILDDETKASVQASKEWQAAREIVSQAQDVFSKAHSHPEEWLELANQILAKDTPNG